MRDDFYFWKQMVLEGKEEYFWREEIYCLTKIYDSFKPFMRFCVDMRIEGREQREIAEITKKSVRNIEKTLYRAKKRIKKAIFNQKAHFNDTSIYRGS